MRGCWQASVCGSCGGRGQHRAAERIAQESARRLSRATERLEAKSERLRLVDPARLLERGYAMLRTSSGAFLMSVQDAPKGTAVQARLVDGVAERLADLGRLLLRLGCVRRRRALQVVPADPGAAEERHVGQEEHRDERAPARRRRRWTTDPTHK